MIFLDYRPPHPALADYVRKYQIIGFEFGKDVPIPPAKAYWPRPENCITFYPKDSEIVEYSDTQTQVKKSKSAIIGQPTVITKRYVGRDFLLFQVVLQPGALYRMTGLPSAELTGVFEDGENVLGKEMKAVNERLSYANHYEEMIPIVEKFLFMLVSKSKREERPTDKIAKFLIDKPFNISMDELASAACLSIRQFHRQFTERMGISPKMFHRIVKFDNAIKIKNTFPEKDWLSIAVDLGYYDYQHLAKDFKEFTLLSPNAFMQAEGQSPERSFGLKEV